MSQASIFQQRMNVSDVENQVEQKAFCQTLLGGSVRFHKTIENSFLRQQVEPVTSYVEIALRRDYPGNQLANINTVSFFEPFLDFSLRQSGLLVIKLLV